MKPSTAAQRTRTILQHLSSSSPSRMVSPAPWRETFLAHVKDMDEPSFTLSTLHQLDPSSTSISSIAPRSRTVIYRGMWGNIPVNPKNPASLNPQAYDTDLPTITSDARMEKIPELFRSSEDKDLDAQSRRGGPVEAVFWMPKVKTQWRMRGHTYVIGPDIDTEAAAPVRKALQEYMRSSKGEAGADDSWSWSRELTAHFGNLSPGMRGSFKNPPPGTPLETTKPGDGEGLGQKVTGLDDEIARKNFRVVIIVPEEIDRVDLSDPERGRRWNYSLRGTEWKMVELWP